MNSEENLRGHHSGLYTMVQQKSHSPKNHTSLYITQIRDRNTSGKQTNNSEVVVEVESKTSHPGHHQFIDSSRNSNS